MANYTSQKAMLCILCEVQRLQVAILRAGKSAHLDASVNDDNGEVYFDLTVFEGDSIDRIYSFTYLDTEEENRAMLALLLANVNAM